MDGLQVLETCGIQVACRLQVEVDGIGQLAGKKNQLPVPVEFLVVEGILSFRK